MSDVPGDLRYTKSHEWVRIDDDNQVTVGITDHAQALLGDMVFVETPEIGSEVAAGEACAVVESVKAASDVYSPVSGEILEANANLADSPETVNDNPYEAGWIFQVKLNDVDDLDSLMDADEYEVLCANEE